MGQKNKKIYYFDYLISFFQILAYIVSILTIKPFFRPKITLSENIYKLKKGSLLVANHQSVFDSCIVLISLPFSVFLRLLPVRLPTCHKFMSRPYFQLLRLLGAYNIGNTSREKMISLFYTRQLLQKGKTIFLFPEGKFFKTKEVGEFKKGIQFFINECQNAVFVRIMGFDKINLRTLINSKRQLTFSKVKDFKGRKINAANLKMILEEL